ncbi:MAG TPA: NAD(P)/FAD-dependent oxidoreductase [Polyangiales bacterium]|nr:NAD(P)/FAD-dependent oxidoreductase [Polyangiales bacterium]
METEILIVGAGFAGLGMGIRLRQAGVENFLILEQSAGLGGTWYDNRYPGAACDVPSHLYSFSFEHNPKWAREHASQREILAYLERCADKYGVRPHIRFRRKVVSARFDEARGMWSVSTEDGRTYSARVLIASCGSLSRPAYPQLPGLSSFAGTLFHTARWREDAPLDGKRIAVVGTGASAVQIVPELVSRAQKLEVFQRTPGWVLPKIDPPIDARWQKRFAAHPWMQALARRVRYLRLELVAPTLLGRPKWLGLGPWLEKQALRYLESQVRDPVLRAALTPSYRIGCKRILLSNEYFAALQRPNAELVTSAISEVTPHGIRTADGREHELDAIVLATGFQAAENLAPFPVRGRNAEELTERWRQGAEAYLGTSVAGFPNFFMLVGPNTSLGHSSMVFMIECQVAYILDALHVLRSRSLKTIEVQRPVQDAFNRKLRERMGATVWATGGCGSWYQTRTGKITTLWPGFTFEFRWRTRRFDAENYTLEPLPARDGALRPAAGRQIRPGLLS